jgi:hypothetical protein
MAKDGLFLSSIAAAHARFGTPAPRLALQAGPAVLIAPRVALIASWFNYINRVADVLGVGREG